MSSVELTDERKKEIGQHFVFGFIGTDLDEDLRRLIRDYHVGHLILMKRNIRDGVQTRQLVREIQTLAKEVGHLTPILIGTDQENGWWV
ncbi:glycoside hydrolase family 3 protein [Pleurotus ostreatus PC15]|uniref:Glycoside hydrolase family 3 protein n=1 Tax=Pleurotus ostreatus (strain PC15) TaxID=1137138 RepID=A0A067NIZ9_PLEO1|nr:glycoside hydrolase family 3 protein [Pleurotus ostreatus PC15]